MKEVSDTASTAVRETREIFSHRGICQAAFREEGFLLEDSGRSIRSGCSGSSSSERTSGGDTDRFLRAGLPPARSSSRSSRMEACRIVSSTGPELSMTAVERSAFWSEDMTTRIRLIASSRVYPSRVIRRSNCRFSGSHTHQTESQRESYPFSKSSGISRKQSFVPDARACSIFRRVSERRKGSITRSSCSRERLSEKTSRPIARRFMDPSGLM